MDYRLDEVFLRFSSENLNFPKVLSLLATEVSMLVGDPIVADN